MVRSPDVNDVVETPLEELVEAIGSIAGKVSRSTRLADEDAVFVVAVVTAAQPYGPVALVSSTSPQQLLDNSGDGPAVVKTLLAEPNVKGNAQGVAILAQHLDHAFAHEAEEQQGTGLISRNVAVALAVLGSEGLAKLGVNPATCMANVGAHYQQGIAAVGPSGFQAAIQQAAQTDRWARRWLERMNS